MLITLDAKEIRDLAEFVGFAIKDQNYEDILETEIDIYDGSKALVSDEDVQGSKQYKHVALINDYYDEGCMPLGDEIK